MRERPIEEPPLRLTPPYDREDRSLFRQRWENAETHRNRLRKRKTAVLLEALADAELSGYERRCLAWVAAWETHMVATLASLMRRSYAAGVEAARERNCNDNCNDADRGRVS